MNEGQSGTKGGPFEEQRRIYDLLAQETRHLIVQYVLGHPEHLMSLDELAYMIPKSKGAISDQLGKLVDADVLAVYRCEGNEDKRDLPAKFYGFKENGVEILYEYNYLRGVPVARALYDSTEKTAKVQRHESAPRPELPVAVNQALSFEGSDRERSPLASYVRDRNWNQPSVSDQVELARAFKDAGVGPDHDGLKLDEIESELNPDLDYHVRTVLHNLEAVDVVEKEQPPGPSVYAISESTDEIVNGHVVEAAKENLDALVNHMDDEVHEIDVDQFQADSGIAVTDGAGRTIRSLLSEEFGVSPERVEERLRQGDSVNTLNAAIGAIEVSEDARKRGDYGKIRFVNPAYRYRLTEKAVEMT
jgi:hypothetical protein